MSFTLIYKVTQAQVKPCNLIAPEHWDTILSPIDNFGNNEMKNGQKRTKKHQNGLQYITFS